MIENRKNHKLNKKFVQGQNSQQRRNYYNQNIIPIIGEDGRFIDGLKRLIFDKNKRDLRASGLSLLPLALRPLLFGVRKSDNFQNSKHIRLKYSYVISFLFVIFGFFLFQNSYTNKVSAASLTLTIPSGISLNVTPETNAKFSKSSASTLSVKSDANFGYTLNIKAKDSTNVDTNGSSLVNSTNSSSKIISISSPVSESDFSSKGTSNTWGYLPSKLNSSANTNYQPGPGTGNTTLEKTSSANADKANDYTITLGTKTDNTLVAGTYKNTFVFTASTNTVSYNITYDLNDGSWTGTSPQTGSTIESSVNISSVTPTKSNYTFEGWCSTTVTDNNTTNPTCPQSATKYSVGEAYNLSNGTNNLDLYAMWKSTSRSYTINYSNNFTGHGTPSNVPSTQSGSATSPYSVTLRNDTPTLPEYTFKGWCTSSSITNNGTINTPTCSETTYQPNTSITIPNDDYSLTLYAMWSYSGPTECSTILTKGQTSTMRDSRDNTTYSIARLNDGRCWMTSNLRIAGRTLTSSTSDVSSNFTLPSSSTSGFSNYDTSYVYVDSTYGGYYSWFAATAGEGKQSLSSGNTSHSICPKGWKLPSNGEFNALVYAQGSASMSTKSPANFQLGGWYSSGSPHDQGSSGYYWSSTAFRTDSAYHPEVTDSEAFTFIVGSKSSGSSVRCVAR